MLKQRLLSALLAIVLFVIPALGSSAAVPSATSQYLQAQNKSDAWVVMALRAAGQPVSADALSTDNLFSATDIERTILGVVAGGGNPFDFRGTNLVALLDAKRNNGQIGDPDLINDDIFGVLAYVAAGYTAADSRVSDSIAYFAAAQNSDGGWGYRKGAASDSNMTAMAIMAHRHQITARYGYMVREKGLAFLRSLQQNDGGFPISAAFTSDTASTSWVISALYSEGIDPRTWTRQSQNPFDFLNSTAEFDGSYGWKPSDTNGSPVMTAYAAIALAGKSYPVAKYSQPAPSPVPLPVPTPTPTPIQPVILPPLPAPLPAPVSGPAAPSADTSTAPNVRFRIEGLNKRVCQGQAPARTAYQVIEMAALQCGFTHQTQWTSMGAYVYRIGEDSAHNDSGWMYRVNWKQLSVSADQAHLKEGDYVTWYFGRYDKLNMRLTVINSQDIPTGERIYVLAEHEVNGQFVPVSNVNIYVNGYFRYETDASGVAVFTMPLGWISFYGEKNDHVRSHVISYEVR